MSASLPATAYLAQCVLGTLRENTNKSPQVLLSLEKCLLDQSVFVHKGPFLPYLFRQLLVGHTLQPCLDKKEYCDQTAGQIFYLGKTPAGISCLLNSQQAGSFHRLVLHLQSCLQPCTAHTEEVQTHMHYRVNQKPGCKSNSSPC